MFANYQRMQPTKLFLGNFLGNSLFNLSWKLKESQPMYVIPEFSGGFTPFPPRVR